jgi:transcriptional regulator with XRE-family HTH domain
MEAAQRPNTRLRLQRRLRGWSQEDVAAGLHRLAANLGEAELGVDATMVSRWERGTRRPRPRYVRLLCSLFELPAEQLGIVDDSEFSLGFEGVQGALEDHDVDRRDFIHKVSALLGVAALPMPRLQPAGSEPWDRLSRAVRLPGRVGEETVEHLEQVTYALEALGPTQVSSRAILGPVTGHLDAILQLLQGPLPPALRRRLCSLAGETAGFAGWLRWDMDDPAGVAAYFRSALEAAREAGDRPLVAYLVGSSACQPPHREDPAERLRRLRASGDGFKQSDATPASQVWMAAKEADACALIGDASGCLRALDRAGTILETEDVAADAASRRPRFSPVNSSWLAGERGASLAKLGRSEDAREILRPVIAALGPEKERDRLWLSTSLAQTYVKDEEPEEACRVARDVLDRAGRMQVYPILKIVQGLRTDLRPYGSTAAVRELDDHLEAVGMRTAV